MKIAKYEDENECKVIENEKGQIEVEKRVRRKQIKNKEWVLMTSWLSFCFFITNWIISNACRSFNI